MPAHDLTDGQLLADLKELAMEARDRVEAYVDAADPEHGNVSALGRALVFTEKVNEALHPTRRAYNSSVWMLEHRLKGFATKSLLPEDDAFETFLREHPELDQAPTLRRRPRPRPGTSTPSTASARPVNDFAVREALVEALRRSKKGNVSAGEVARVLFNDEHVSHAEKVRVGQALGRLFRFGKAARSELRRAGDAYRWSLADGEAA